MEPTCGPDENAASKARNQPNCRPVKRKALGDIGNLAGSRGDSSGRLRNYGEIAGNRGDSPGRSGNYGELAGCRADNLGRAGEYGNLVSTTAPWKSSELIAAKNSVSSSGNCNTSFQTPDHESDPDRNSESDFKHGYNSNSNCNSPVLDLCASPGCDSFNYCTPTTSDSDRGIGSYFAETGSLSPYTVEEQFQDGHKKRRLERIVDCSSRYGSSNQEFCRRLSTLKRQIDESSSIPPYLDEISNYLFTTEKKHQLENKYLDGSLTINGRGRQVLADWIAEICQCSEYSSTAFFLAVNILDRCLSAEKNMAKDEVQMMGVGSLHVAVKYEHGEGVCTKEFLEILKGSCIETIEARILKLIDYDLSFPCPTVFFNFFFMRMDVSLLVPEEDKPKLKYLGHYIMELGAVCYASCHLSPKESAAGSLALALMILTKKHLNAIFSMEFEKLTRSTFAELMPGVKILANIFTSFYKNSKYQAVPDKYSSSEYLCISILEEVQPWHWEDYIFKF